MNDRAVRTTTLEPNRNACRRRRFKAAASDLANRANHLQRNP